MCVTLKTGYGIRENGRNRLAVPGQTVNLPDSEATELIARGLAVPAAGGPLADAECGTPGTYPSEGGKPVEAVETGHLDHDQLQSMTLAELKKLAEEMGLYAHDLRKKSDVIALITAKAVEVEDGDTPPDIGAEGPVV